MSAARLRLGTSSWSEKAWVGPFYPPGSKPGEFLALYAGRYDTVEADVTYYRIPEDRLVDGWRAKTPDGFRLCAKFPRTIVHAGSGPRPDGERVLVPEHTREDTERFLKAMLRLGDRCGPLVLQFPYFNRTAFASKEPFLERLNDFLGFLPKDLRYAVELRNRNWLGPDLIQILRAHGVALTLVDLPYMPSPKSWAKAVGGSPADLVTTDFTYLRLIGDRKKTEEAASAFDRTVLDLSERLVDWAELLTVLREQVNEVYGFANNHFAGYGPGTIDEFADRLR